MAENNDLDDIRALLEGEQLSGFRIDMPDEVDRDKFITVQVLNNRKHKGNIFFVLENNQGKIIDLQKSRNSSQSPIFTLVKMSRPNSGSSNTGVFLATIPTGELKGLDNSVKNLVPELFRSFTTDTLSDDEYTIHFYWYIKETSEPNWDIPDNSDTAYTDIESLNNEELNFVSNDLLPAFPERKKELNKKGGDIPLPLSIFHIGSRTFRINSPFDEYESEGGDNVTESKVSLKRTQSEPSSDQILWTIIRNGTINFKHYKRFMDSVMCGPTDKGNSKLPFAKVEMYSMLKDATECYMMQECRTYDNGVGELDVRDRAFWEDSFYVKESMDYMQESRKLGWKATPQQLRKLKNQYLEQLEGDIKVIPYFKLIREKLHDLPLKDSASISSNCYGILRSEIAQPCLLELIWTYWMEQGMLVQTMNAISLRFQNIKANTATDPLMRLDLNPLRSLSNLLWGYAQDEQHRLTIGRRAYEYDHQYGLTLVGKAVPQIRPVDSRSQFLEVFHTLLYHCTIFFKEDDDTTRVADAFPLLHQLREVHMLLAEGAHNQYGSLTWTSRHEMLMQQWLLSRSEFREFLGGKAMVPYKEEWMDRVDTMRAMQGWGDTGITYFADLATLGEQILLSIRLGNWSNVNDRIQAVNWVRAFRDEIQMYIHAYRAVTGVDLSSDSLDRQESRFVQPSLLLQQKATGANPVKILGRPEFKRV